jgi:hypothetical protein
MKSLILSSILLLTACVNAQILDDVWELSELNDPNYTDAYPYLTDDGLRIYFTSNDGMGNNLFFSSRPDLDTDFASKQLLDSTLFSNILSSWLTPDELEMYFTNYIGLFHVTRPTTTSPFGTVTEITLVGGNTAFISGPSLAPGGDELYLYNGDGLLEFEYTNDTTYTFVSEVLPPLGYGGGVGQLSKDGLELYWSLNLIGSDLHSLFIAERSSLGTSFSNPVQMNSLINVANINNSQPSYATAANALVWVRNDLPLWEGNQLYVAQASEVSVVELGPESKELVKIVDLLGRETNYVPGVVLIYVYSDGSTEKRFGME